MEALLQGLGRERPGTLCALSEAASNDLFLYAFILLGAAGHTFPDNVDLPEYFSKQLSVTETLMRQAVTTKRDERPLGEYSPDAAAGIQARLVINSVPARPESVAFRRAIRKRWDGRCPVTGEHVDQVLRAAHIRPDTDGGPSEADNGLYLRADIDRLFEAGDRRPLLSIGPTGDILVSRSLWATEYGTLRGRRLQGRDVDAFLSSAHIAWHRTVFEANESISGQLEAGSQCLLTGCAVRRTLIGAHIIPRSHDGGTVGNVIPLRADVDRLFEACHHPPLISLDPKNFTWTVSAKLQASSYAGFHDLKLPEAIAQQISRDSISWHYARHLHHASGS
jgi:hypothetical protein